MATSITPGAVGTADEGILIVKVTGQMTAADWRTAQQAALVYMRRFSNYVPILIMAENFLGWESGGWGRGDWADSPFQPEFDNHVQRMAIVGDKQWEDLALLFVSKGLRCFPVEFFPPSGMNAARRWLKADAQATPGN